MSNALAPTLLVSSIEGLLDDEQIEQIVAEIDGVLGPTPERFLAGVGGASIHGIEGRTPEECAAVYEPNGRIEVPVVPALVSEIANAAVRSRWPHLLRLAPHVAEIDDWVYLEYGPGQFIEPHIDRAQNDDDPARPKVIGISIALETAAQGGEFFVETTASPELWTGGDVDDIRTSANPSTDWFRTLPRTRWTVRPTRGSALVYGTRLIHGTAPVRRGRARKLISWLLGSR